MGVGRPKFDFHTAVHHKYGADRHLALPHGGVGEVQRPLHPPIVLGRVVVLARIVGVGGFHLCAAALRFTSCSALQCVAAAGSHAVPCCPERLSLPQLLWCARTSRTKTYAALEDLCEL